MLWHQERIALMIAFLYYHISWILYVLRLAWSYGLNADLFRRIGLDERIHKEESLQRMENPRFSTSDLLDLKSKYEEDLLEKIYPEYKAYKNAVKKRLIPWVY